MVITHHLNENAAAMAVPLLCDCHFESRSTRCQPVSGISPDAPKTLCNMRWQLIYIFIYLNCINKQPAAAYELVKILTFKVLEKHI